MSAAVQAGLARACASLTAVLERGGVDVMRLAEDLFGLSDIAAGDPRLRRSLTDPGRSAQERGTLAEEAFGAHVLPQTLEVVRDIVAEHWSDPMDLHEALEVLGITATLEDARSAGRLEDVEHELFGVSELLGANRELRDALSDMGAGTPHERGVLAVDVFGPHLSRWAMRLVRRGVARTSHGRLLWTLRRFCDRAADMRGCAFATVEAARPLTDAQTERLRSVVSAQLGREASLNITVDPSLVGGFRVRSGTTSIDSSVSARVAELRRALTH